jgi:hypothetical protein
VELGVVIGGILVPLAAAFFPRARSNRLSLFLPASALLPTAVIAMGFKLAGIISQKESIPELVHRPSEAVEFYLYFFILGYLIIFTLRIRELEIQEARTQPGSEPHIQLEQAITFSGHHERSNR